jgi:AraC-like DNA-binding protein
MLRTMKIILTPQQKQQLEVMHDSTRDGRVRDRIKAVLLASEGWSQTMISQALRIHESTVARHLSDYVLSEKLKPEFNCEVRHSSISSSQCHFFKYNRWLLEA